MAEGKQSTQPWKAGDEITADRLEMQRQLAESAQLHAGSKNVRVYKGALGGTAIVVDPTTVVPQAATATVKITGNAAGGGKYTGYLVKLPTVNIPATGNLTEAEVALVEVNVVRIVNRREVGKSTHDLAASGFLPLIFDAVFLKTADDGVAVYAIDGAQQEDCA